LRLEERGSCGLVVLLSMWAKGRRRDNRRGKGMGWLPRFGKRKKEISFNDLFA
jgi:hypothetical protein